MAAINVIELYNKYVSEGHSEKWALKRVDIDRMEEQMKLVTEDINELIASDRTYSNVSFKLENLETTYSGMEESLEELHSELRAIELEESEGEK